MGRDPAALTATLRRGRTGVVVLAAALAAALAACAGSVPATGYLDRYEDMQRSMLGDYWYAVAPEYPLHRYARLWIAQFDIASSVAGPDSGAVLQLMRRMRAELSQRLQREHVFADVVLDETEDVDLYLYGAVTRFSGGNRAARFFGTGAPRAQIEVRVLDGTTHAEVARIVAVPAEVVTRPGTVAFGETDRFTLAYRAALAFYDFFYIEREKARKASQ